MREDAVRRTIILLVVGLLLVSFVSPFSYLPNPLGVAYLILGGYTYDARLPFLVNRFAALQGNVEVALAARLDGLLGATGLDPLDPSQPLRSYQIETVTYGGGFRGEYADAVVRMVYADGSNRRYRIPVVQRSQSWGWPGGWAYTGLDRYFAPHRELPHLPLAGPDSPVRLGTPRRLPLSKAAHRLGSTLPYGWYTSTPRDGEDLVLSPAGDAFLLATCSQQWCDGSGQLWLIPLADREPIRLADELRGDAAYVWSSDGRWIVYRRPVPAGPLARAPAVEIVAIGRDGRVERVLGRTDLFSSPAAVGDSAWYLAEGALGRSSLAGGGPSRVATLPDLPRDRYGEVPFALAPDARRLAYRCGDALCLADVDGGAFVRVDLGTPPRPRTPTPGPKLGVPGPVPTPLPYQPPPVAPASTRPAFARLELAWSLGGDRLAAVASNHGQKDQPTLFLVDRDGQLLRQTVVGPNGLTRGPQWTPDGRWIFLNAFPEAGRRIVAIEAASGQAFDLSQPGWDTFFTLAPDGRRLLLWNGRGGFWAVDVEID